MKGYDDGLCLNCVIAVCDERHAQCFYRIWREAEREARPDREATLERNREYYKRWYQANRERKLAAVAQHQRANPEQHRSRQKAYYARKQEQQNAE